MKQRQFKLTKIKLVSIVLVSSFMAWIVYSASAATGTLSLTSNKTSIKQGENFTVTISVNSDTPAAYSTAKVSYDTNQLTFIDPPDYSGSAYPTSGPDTNIKNGVVTISRYIVPDNGASFPSGKFTLAKLNFQAKSGATGKSTLSIDQSGSEIFGTGGENILTSTTGVSVTLTAPVTPPSPSNPPTSNPAGPTQTSNTTNNTNTSTNAPTTSHQNHTSQTPSSTTDPTPVNVPNSNTSYYPPTTQKPLAPGESRSVASVSISQRLLALVRKLLPALVVGLVAGGAIWFIFKKLHERPFGFSGVSSNMGGVGTVKAPPATQSSINKSDPIQPATSSKPTTVPVKNDPNDHTPRTFSGV